jgi:hypothetical protein
MAYTDIGDPTQYFDVVTYAGDGGSSKTITGLGFQADFLWIKNRTEAREHILANLKLNPPIIGAYDAVGGSVDTIITLSVSADTKNYVVFNEALIAGYDGKGLVTINLTLSSNAKIGSRFSGLPGLDFRGFPTNCVLNLTVNSGSAIYGCGGTGGRGGGWGSVAPSGSAGGDAIWLDKAITIVNNGTVAGGGGGGGGGAGWAPTGMYGMGGAGGGGGAGFDGGAGGSFDDSSGGVTAATSGSAGSTAGGGSGGSGSSKDGYTTHSGATGGGLGAAGGGSTGSHTSWAGQVSSGGAGGAGGKYIDGNTYATWSTEGTRTGSANASVTNGVALSPYLRSDTTSSLQTDTDRLLEINSTGFKVGADISVNENAKNFVGWAWKAKNGAATFNDASATGVGTIDSVHEANTTAGFSIVTYTGTTSAGSIAHGLGAVPKMIIVKNRDDGAENWAVQSPTASDPWTDYMYLDTTNAASDDANLWNDTAPTSTVFSIGTSGVVNQAENHVAYCFAEKQGYSKIGSYTGNGSTDGTFVYTGFKPAWVMCKSTASTSDWYIYDNKREGYNIDNDHLLANSTAVEATADEIDMLSNGFKLRIATDPNVAEAYIYMAFAEHPFVSSEGVPTTAR